MESYRVKPEELSFLAEFLHAFQEFRLGDTKNNTQDKEEAQHAGEGPNERAPADDVGG